MTRRRRLIIAVVVLLTALVAGAFIVMRTIEHRIYEAYALKRTNYLLSDYYCQHASWPSDWDALISIAESIYPGSGESYVAELRDVVGVDWSLDIAALLETDDRDDRSGFQTTYLLSGGTVRFMDSYDEIYGEIHSVCSPSPNGSGDP